MKKEKPYLPLEVIRKYEPEMRTLEVSEVARSPRGFLTAYKRVNGDHNRLSESWRVKRSAFISRSLPQYKAKPTKRRKLSLIAWAYMPRERIT